MFWLTAARVQNQSQQKSNPLRSQLKSLLVAAQKKAFRRNSVH